MKSAEASSSFAPWSLLKWLVDRIQISRGILTDADQRDGIRQVHRGSAGLRKLTGDSLIMLHGGREGNNGECAVRRGYFLFPGRRRMRYLGVAGVTALGFGCLAMI